MSRDLDIDDVVAPYPEAKQELAVMRDAFAEMLNEVATLRTLLWYARPYIEINAWSEAHECAALLKQIDAALKDKL